MMGSVATLVLGTAQWGLDYGVTNAQGRVSDEELIRAASLRREPAALLSWPRPRTKSMVSPPASVRSFV